MGQGRNPAALSDVRCVLFLFIFRVIAIAYLPQRTLKMHRYDELIPEKKASPTWRIRLDLPLACLNLKKLVKMMAGKAFLFWANRSAEVKK